VIGWQRTVMGLAELLECDASLRSAKECLHVRFGQAEDGGAVTLGVFIPGLGAVRDCVRNDNIWESTLKV
jgi:hypothetical protein